MKHENNNQEEVKKDFLLILLLLSNSSQGEGERSERGKGSERSGEMTEDHEAKRKRIRRMRRRT